jgi:uncharacterized protein YqjF (DUF2071 family)
MVVDIEMGWRHLLFEHYPVDPAVVAPHLPTGLAPDTYDGDAWLSVVPFTNVDVRPAGVPPELGFGLPELNLRTYVVHEGDPGVYFFSLDADGLLGVAGARLFHRLPYFYADADLDVVGDGDPRIRFRSRRRHPGATPAEYAATYRPTGEPFRPEPGSLAAFLVERYCYFAATPDGIRRADVDHERWPLRAATADVERNTLFCANGFETPDADPIRHYSRGFDVRASRSRPV